MSKGESLEKSVIAVVGPTAAGKSDLALKVAQHLNGEIINADSRQVYRHMDIGTAKPTPDELSAVPHHLIDIADPDDAFSLAIYQDLAYKAIADVRARGRTPILVGGSGLYVWAVLKGWGIPKVPPNVELRQGLESRAREKGLDDLVAELRTLDPVAAGQIDARNVRRVIRALEVCIVTGERFSDLRKKTPPDFDAIVIGLTTERTELYNRIDNRVCKMIDLGLVDEVRSLIDRGYSLNLPSLSSVGYREIRQFLSGGMELSEAVQKIKYETHRLARHQYAWFRLNDTRIQWLNSNSENVGTVLEAYSGLHRTSQ